MYLKSIAEAFVREYGTKVSNLTFVFPNHRAGLFFRKYLSQSLGDSTIFAPEMLAISDVFQQVAQAMPKPLRLSDSMQLVFRLWTHYQQLTHSTAEEFERFVYWAKIILSDFNELDANMVNARDVLENVRLLRNIDDLFAESEQKRHFLAFWDVLVPLYEEFRTSLLADGLAYTGLMQREVVSYLHSLDLSDNSSDTLPLLQSNIVFIGFNALNKAEHSLFAFFRDNCNADFYWDYTGTLLQDPHNSASTFSATNLKDFPSKIEVTIPNIPLEEKSIELFAVSTDMAQASVVGKILKDIASPQTDLTNTAIILPDETMLQPLMHAFPPQIEAINVTMGYPLARTHVHSLVLAILDVLAHSKAESGDDGKHIFYYKPLFDLLHHPYIQQLYGEQCNSFIAEATKRNVVYISLAQLPDAPLLTKVIKDYVSAEQKRSLMESIDEMLLSLPVFEQVQSDYVLRYSRLLHRLSDLTNAYHSTISSLSLNLLTSIIKELVSTETVPFEGEPLDGLQVMGVLETRALDFENIIILSVNDDVFPEKSKQQSFIPHNIRSRCGLPLPERTEAINAYNFYRMVSHSKHIWFITNNTATDSRSGEVSRYVHQLVYQYGLPLQPKVLSIPLDGAIQPNLILNNSTLVAEAIERYFDPQGKRGLSPSALNNYLQCPLKFFLSDVCQYPQSAQITEDVESNTFGTVFHSVLEKIYTPYVGKQVTMSAIEDILKQQERLQHLVRQTYVDHVGRMDSPLNALDELAINAVFTYTVAVLEHDKQLAPFRILGLEKKCSRLLSIPSRTAPIRLKGTIDRVDEVNGEVRVIDYKTGGVPDVLKNKERLFADSSHLLQTLFYGLLLEDEHYEHVFPHVYYVRQLSKQAEVDTHEHIGSEVVEYGNLREQFTEQLTNILVTITDPSTAFVPKPNERRCTYCQFAQFCFI